MELKYSLLIFLSIVTSVVGAIPEHREDGHYKDGEHIAEHDHKIFLGEEQEKEFGKLTVEESIERLGKLVDKIDKDGNNNITRTELADWIKYISLKEPTETTGKEFDVTYGKATKDDGLLSWQENLDMNFPGHHQKNKSLQPRIEQQRKRFVAADENKDDKLSKEEFVAFRHSHLFPRMHDVLATEIHEELDDDNDGSVSIKNFIKVTKYKEEDATKEFKIRDTNQNGALDVHEIKEWYFPSNHDTDLNEADHLINHADSNKDKVLTKEEILQNHDVFVGSKATYWGESLKRPSDEL